MQNILVSNSCLGENAKEIVRNLNKTYFWKYLLWNDYKSNQKQSTHKNWGECKNYSLFIL